MVQSANNAPKKNHFLPKAYLRGFSCDGEYIWTYSNLWAKSPRKANIRNAGQINKLYAIPLDNNEMDCSTLEKLFNKIETPYPLIIEKILKRENLSDIDRAQLSQFIAIQFYRVPGMINNINQSISELANHFIKSNDFEIKAMDHVGLLGLTAAEKVAKMIFNMKWKFFYAPKNIEFVTTDCPVSLSDPSHKSNLYGIGFANRNIEVMFPVTKEVILIATWGHNDDPELRNEMIAEINAKGVKNISKLIVSAGIDYVYSSKSLPEIQRLTANHLKKAQMILKVN